MFGAKKESAFERFGPKCLASASFATTTPISPTIPGSKVAPRAMEKVRSAWQQFSRDQLSAAELWRGLLAVHWCGEQADSSAVPPDVPLVQILGLIADDERRLALYRTALHLHPCIATYCCNATMCFTCKTSWHRGKTCEEKRREEAAARVMRLVKHGQIVAAVGGR